MYWLQFIGLSIKYKISVNVLTTIYQVKYHAQDIGEGIDYNISG